jgi:hypothetical protein
MCRSGDLGQQLQPERSVAQNDAHKKLFLEADLPEADLADVFLPTLQGPKKFKTEMMAHVTPTTRS